MDNNDNLSVTISYETESTTLKPIENIYPYSTENSVPGNYPYNAQYPVPVNPSDDTEYFYHMNLPCNSKNQHNHC